MKGQITRDPEADKAADYIIDAAKPTVKKEPVPGQYDDIRARGGRVNGRVTIDDLRKKHGRDV